MPIDANRLRDLRKRKRWTQQELAEKAGVNMQTIYKAEKDGWANPRPKILANLVKLFGVSADVLARTAPLPPSSDGDLEKSYPALRVRVSAETRNAYPLVALRYGVSERMIANLAPVLFAIIAQQSLRQRSEAVDELEKTAASLREAAQALPHLGRRVGTPHDDGTMIAAERRSIAARDISAKLTRSAIPKHDELPMDPESDHLKADPFSIFVRNAATCVGLKVRRWPIDDDPVRITLADEIKLLADGDSDLETALGEGWILIRDIPAELRQPDRGTDRVAWLRERLASDEYAREEKKQHDEMSRTIDEVLDRNAPADAPDA